MPIRAILFDIGETLWHAEAAPPADEFRRRSAERVAAVLARHRCAPRDPAEVSRSVWAALEDAIRQARDGDLREPDYVSVARDTLLGLGIDAGPVCAGEVLDAAYISGAEGGKAPYPDAAPTLRELRRRGFLLGTVTNRAFGGARFRADLRAAGLDIGWDAQSVSVEVGYLKPHTAIFEHALWALRVEREEALMVGNSLREDIAGAQRLGIAAAWRRCRPDAEGVVPDYTFAELAELLSLPALQEAA